MYFYGAIGLSTVGLAVTNLLLLASPAQARDNLDVNLQIGLPDRLAISIDAGLWRDLRVRVIGAGDLDSYRYALVIGEVRRELAANHFVSVSAGLNQKWGQASCPLDSVGPCANGLRSGLIGYTVGAAYMFRSDRIEIKINPSVSFIPGSMIPIHPLVPEWVPFYYPSIFDLAGPLVYFPLFEVGYLITQNISLSLQSSITPLGLKASF